MKTPKENIISVLSGKKVLFLENDTSLDNGLDEFENILKEAGIKYKVLFDLSEMPLDVILFEIKASDAIVFQTQWVYEISKQLREYMFASKDKKIAIEVYINEPSFYYKPKSVHDVYIFHYHDIDNEHSFYKLHASKAYWDFKNEFDK